MEKSIEMRPENLINDLNDDITNIIKELESFSLKEYVQILNSNETILKAVKKYAFDSLIEKISSRCDFNTSEYLIDKYKLNNKKIDEDHYFDKNFYKNIQIAINKYIEEKITEIKNKYSNHEDFYANELEKNEKENSQVKSKVKILENEIGEDNIDDELEDYYNNNVTETSTEICKLYQQWNDLENKILDLKNCIKIVIDFISTYQNSELLFDYEIVGKFHDDGYSVPDVDYEHLFDEMYSIINNYSDYLTINLGNKLIKNKNKFIKLDKVFDKIITDIGNDNMISLSSKKIYLEGIRELSEKIEKQKNRKIKK